ncbi:MAG: hypothetical protein DRR42_15025 [Gammaproteobacteria bacterium]|nr:MAG: hypothetical protein DRR42_15025 [Gammaproteobacteria bacterium]
MTKSFLPKVQGAEVTYELHSLGWKAFQNLCVTVMGEVWGQVVQGFFDSHDGGRDGAFHGTWAPVNGESFCGAFTAQCKFTAKADKCIKLPDLKDDLAKAKRLAKKGLADNYILFTNARLTGSNDAEIRQAFLAVPGISQFAAYGSERISQIIRESPRLRMLVPRVYGLGDLSQILDERAYSQGQEILSALGDDLAKFVITEAYQQSAKALLDHGFVLLLGEPACGKSTIAAALALGALDQWGCFTVKARDADEFVKYFNPHEKQFFWVDDAFGPTQIDWRSAFDWSRTFPHVNAAIRRGAKVLFTSRDYIYKAAKQHLKESALPVMKESQVVIQVENLTKEEREQILYNHIRLGTQPQEMKAKLKPLLPGVAAHKKFSPEIARRLGNPLFTRELTVSKYGLDDFVANPLELLCEIITTLDDGSRSALALVFMRGGKLPSPVRVSEDEEKAITQMGGSTANVLNALQSLDGSLLLNSLQGGNYAWRFKHPTIRDAFAVIVAENRDLMDIYLTGAPLDKLVEEVSCGNVGIEGVKVIVPLDRYDAVMTRLESFDLKKWYDKHALHRFLSYRCDQEFLRRYTVRYPEFISSLSVRAYLYAVSDVDVLVRLHEFGLLPEPKRLLIVATIKNLAIDVPDSGFLREEIRRLMTQEELIELLERVRMTLLPNLDWHIEQWRDNYNGDDDPETYFEELTSALQDYNEEFKENEHAVARISKALEGVNQHIEELQSEFPEDWDDGYSLDRPPQEDAQNSLRSIFDDVDK